MNAKFLSTLGYPLFLRFSLFIAPFSLQSTRHEFVAGANFRH
jgi:hypothetical protein